jgi:hypothetical protein
MRDVDIFITVLYVLIDNFCQSEKLAQTHHPAPQAALSGAEVATLTLFGQWAQFPSERAFYRYAERSLQAAFLTLPARSQFNRFPPAGATIDACAPGDCLKPTGNKKTSPPCSA